MAFPQILGTSKGVNGSNTTSHSATLPASISANELIVVMWAFDGNPGLAGGFPTNWSGYYQNNVASGTPAALLMWKRADGTEGGTSITVTTVNNEQSSYVAMRLSVNTLIGMEGSGIWLTGNSTNSTFNLAGSPLISAKDYTIIAFRSGDGSVQPTAPSTNYTLVNSQAGGGTGASVYVQKREINATSNTAGALTVATEQWATMSVSFFFDDFTLEKEQKLGVIGTAPIGPVGAFSFLSNGLNLKKVYTQIFKGATAGTSYIELYAHSGTFGSTGIPTGSPLATSNTLTITGSSVYGAVGYEFPTPYQTTNGTPYFIRVVNTGSVTFTYYGASAAGGAEGNTADFSGSVWTSSTRDRPRFVLLSTVSAVNDISESIGVTESQSATATFLRTQSETISATDTTDETLQTTGSISESISVTEEQASGGAVISASVSESISVTESQNRTLTQSASVSESISPSDTTDETAVLVRSISESIGVTESQGRAVTFSVSVSELINATETQNSSYSLLVSVSESVTITESQDSTFVLGVSVSESVSVTETQNRTFTTTATASETISATETQGRTAVTNVSLSESISVTDTPSSTAVLVRSVSESVSITESQLAFYQISGLISESVSVNHSQDATAQATGQYLGTARVYNVLNQGSVSSTLKTGATNIILTQGSVASSMKTGKTKQEINSGTIKTNIGL